jgi:ribonuclease E
VRERAPFIFGGELPAEAAAPEPPQPAAAPEPAAPGEVPEPAAADPASESADENQPRRTGWWSRRFAGGKG